MNDFLSQLKSMSHEQLKAEAKAQGLKGYGNAKPETIIEMLAANVTPPKADKPRNDPKPVEIIAPHSEEAVRDAVRKFLDKGVEAIFPGDGTWHFKYKGAEDSGNLAIPMKTIVMKCANVAKGAFMLRTHRAADFDQYGTNANSAYTSKVLA
jgi:hypothetical protein